MIQITSVESPLVQVQTTLFASNGLGDPSADTVSMAFLKTTAEPQAGDWMTGSWVQRASGQWYAQVKINAGTLTKGTYYHWVKVVDPTETIERCIGLLEVT